MATRVKRRARSERLGLLLIVSAWMLLATQAMSQPGQPPPPPADAPEEPAGDTPAADGAAPDGAEPKDAEPKDASPSTAPAAAPPNVLTPQSGGAVDEATAAGRRFGKRQAEPPPAPTPEMLAALEELQKEASAYEADARDYRGAMTRIIKHHYEERRRRILEALDREIATEVTTLKAARLEAIERLEAFIAKYSGNAADPKNTPDAMFRLAALYEERSREAIDDMELAPGAAPPSPDLKPAIALYKRIVREFPNYGELAGVYYYLGHAYNDSARLEEAQQVWRSLVCHNHFRYPVPPDPTDPSKDSVQRLPQDHEPDWWLGWTARHPKPMDIVRAERGDDAADEVDAADGDENSYKDPYPDSCQAIAQKLDEGEDPRYVAEIWWQIGDYHFEEIDPWGGPYNLNRAESAYRQSMKIEKPPVFGVAMYKLAWTFYKQQRYETAVREFVRLLTYTDEQEKLTGNSGADFRAEAYAYIAGSVTYVDFDGPARNDPYIGRNDIFDLESDSAVIEEKMHQAIDRVLDPDLMPQNTPQCLPKKTSDECPNCCEPTWTVEVFRALAFEYKEYNQYHNLIELDKLILERWPMHRDAPIVQNQIAEVYEQLAGQSRGEEHDKYARLALEARGDLVEYVATPDSIPPWVEANQDDPEAIRTAERLVRGGLRRAAADHTNAARNMVSRAGKEKSAGNDAEAMLYYERALAEYKSAARAWGGYLLMDENADDAYESRFWLADAYTNIVIVKVQLEQMPSAEEVEIAQRTARDVRDSNEDNKYLQNAALMVVKVAQVIVIANYNAFDNSGGAQGFEKREALKFEGEGKERKYVKEPTPEPIVNMITAFDEYVQTVPVEDDPYKNHDFFAYTGGELYFLYGQFDDSRKRLHPVYLSQCGKTEYGYLAWEKLLTMANQDGDTKTSRLLAEAAEKKSCAVTKEQEAKQAGLSSDTIAAGFYQDAAAAYKAAKAMADGPERVKKWREAAELYEGALNNAPARDEAPEAAILGANSWKQIGEYDKAIAMYRLFIKEYGNDERLDKLQKGDAAAGKPPQPELYEDRVKYLKLAYDELAKAYVLFFDYRTAASTYDKIGSITRFEDKDRRVAAQNAVFLYANIGDRTKMDAAKGQFLAMNPSESERAEIEWLAATADLKAWDEFSPDKGSNKDNRLRATRTMDSFYSRFETSSAAAAFTVQAAFNSAKMRRLARDPAFSGWCGKTITQFERYKPTWKEDASDREKFLQGQAADMAAECDYRAIDADISKNFDYAAGKHRYEGVLTKVIDDFTEDVNKGAKGYFDQLQNVIKKYGSRKWAVAARARQGSLYDSCRTGLYNARAPGLKLYTKKEEETLAKADKLCEEEGNEKACNIGDTFRAKRRTDWRNKRDTELAKTDTAMVRGYAEAIEWAKAWKVQVDATDNAIRRLAFFTDIIGDEKLRQYTTGMKVPSADPGGAARDFAYADKMFLRMRRGVTADVKTDVMTSPVPVQIQ